jgi:hypothetical protein
MAQIVLTLVDECHFQVAVIDSSNTTHKVSIQPDYALKLTAGKITTAQLVEKSFEFLLERESNTNILRQFDLSVIARYFPEYETVISR